MSRAIEIMEAQQSPSPSHWRKDAKWSRDNEYWLKYSRSITLRVLQSMEDQSVTQAELARRMGCAQQYVSNLLRGSSNMTLETIARLEKALGLDILNTTLSFVGGYDPALRQRNQCLNEPSSPEDVATNGTATLVDGYAAGKRKKKGPKRSE